MLLSHRCESHYLHFCISHLTFVISHLTHSPRNTLTEPMWDTVKRDLSRIVSNLKLVVFPNPNREDLGKALWDWDLWRPFCFIVFSGLSLTFTWSASVKKIAQLHRITIANGQDVVVQFQHNGIKVIVLEVS
ncbi:hypothetical protein HA466_0077000 [Hirschfeldia incana]|nr:hypothetical protein HA466_0077000 [Hirschfeldia incana]